MTVDFLHGPDIEETASWMALRAAASDLVHLCSLEVSGVKRVAGKVNLGNLGKLLLSFKKRDRAAMSNQQISSFNDTDDAIVA